MIESPPSQTESLDVGPLVQTRVAHCVNPMRESLRAILYRRLTFAYYRASPRYARIQRIPHNDKAVANPLIADVLSVYLADRLPTSVVARLGPAGITRVAQFLEVTFKGAGRVLKAIVKPLRWASRTWRTRRATAAAKQHREHIEAQFLSETPGSRNLGILLDGRVMMEGFSADANGARIWLRNIKPVTEVCQVFVHLYPEQPTLLPPERKIHGYVCKDHYPAIEVKNWRSGKSFRDEIALSDVTPGFYRIEAGLIDVATFRRFPVDGSARTSVDLGWVRVGTGADT